MKKKKQEARLMRIKNESAEFNLLSQLAHLLEAGSMRHPHTESAH